MESGNRGIECGARKMVIDMNDTIPDPDVSPRRGPKRRRRVSDHVMVAFHAACDQGDLEVAQRLLTVVEFMLRRPPPGGRPERRAQVDPLVAAHERLWGLRHPETNDR